MEVDVTGNAHLVFTPPPFHSRRPGLVAPVRVDPTGAAGPTRGRARGPRWRTTSCGFYVPTSVVTTPQQRALEAAAVLRADEAVTGWAALAWEGAAWFDGTSDGESAVPVIVVARRNVRTQPGFEVSQEFPHPDEVKVVDGLPVTLAVRSVTFEMRYAETLTDAVVTLDMACHADLVSIAEVSAYVSQLGPVTGIQQARDSHLSLVGAAKDNSQDAAFRDLGLERFRDVRDRLARPRWPHPSRARRCSSRPHTRRGATVDAHAAEVVDADGDGRPASGPRRLGAATLPPPPPRRLTYVAGRAAAALSPTVTGLPRGGDGTDWRHPEPAPYDRRRRLSRHQRRASGRTGTASRPPPH